MRRVRRSLLAALVVVLAVAAPAAADHLDPTERIRPADQSRARAMLLRPSDLPGFQRQPSAGGDPHLTCSGLDESDLTVTGDAESARWSASVVFVTSSSTVYVTRADAATSWRRGTSAAGMRCLREELAREFARQGARVASLRRLAIPSLAQRSAAYRLRLTATVQGQTVPLTLDFVILMHGRALSALIVGTALTQPDRAAEVRLARVLAARMAAAMRGA
jgi:hypothetical protein